MWRNEEWALRLRKLTKPNAGEGGASWVNLWGDMWQVSDRSAYP